MENKKQQKLVLGLVLVLLVVIFALLNTEPAAINFGITQIKVPLILLIVILLLIGAGVAFLLGKGAKNSISPAELDKRLDQQKKELTEKFAQEKKELERTLTIENEKVNNLKEKPEPPKDELLDSNSENK